MTQQFFIFCPLWPWPLTLTFKLVWVRDQARLPCEFGANPFSCSGDICVTNTKTNKKSQKKNRTLLACGNKQIDKAMASVKFQHPSSLKPLDWCGESSTSDWMAYNIIHDTEHRVVALQQTSFLRTYCSITCFKFACFCMQMRTTNAFLTYKYVIISNKATHCHNTILSFWTLQFWVYCHNIFKSQTNVTTAAMTRTLWSDVSAASCSISSRHALSLSTAHLHSSANSVSRTTRSHTGMRLTSDRQWVNVALHSHTLTTNWN